MNDRPHDETRRDSRSARWRLVLGRFADDALGDSVRGEPRLEAVDRALDYLYGREYEGRGVRTRDADSGDERGAGDGPSALSIPEWIRTVRELFPEETAEVLQSHALDRYGMTELVTDPEVLASTPASYELLRSILAFRSLMDRDVLDVARRLIREVVDDLTRRLAREIRPVLWGRLSKQRRSRLRSAKNFDWTRTIRRNLRHYDRERRRMLLEELHFFSRVEHRSPWRVILAVDQSGSMVDSVIHSAVMAGILAGLPSVRVNVVAFDTQVVDLSDVAHDPAEVLLSVQLGGGTNIAAAVRYCEGLVTQPHRTIVVLVSDFYEGGSVSDLTSTVARLCGAGVHVIGLAALGSDAKPAYDRATARRCAEAGADIAAVTPRRLAEWLGDLLR